MKVTIYTDGSARGNPDGPGGYGTILHYTDSTGHLHTREFSAGYRKTTNNRMELMAVIVGLEALTKPCEGLCRPGEKCGSLETAAGGENPPSGAFYLGERT